MRGIWLFIIAITLHNYLEGLAVGVAFGADPVNAVPLSRGHRGSDMPEGLVVVLALLMLEA